MNYQEEQDLKRHLEVVDPRLGPLALLAERITSGHRPRWTAVIDFTENVPQGLEQQKEAMLDALSLGLKWLGDHS